MSGPDHLADARDAVAQAVTLVAEEIATCPASQGETFEGRARSLDIVATAVARLQYGPQGGEMFTRRESDDQYRSQSDQRIEYVSPNNRPLGFGS